MRYGEAKALKREAAAPHHREARPHPTRRQNPWSTLLGTPCWSAQPRVPPDDPLFFPSRFHPPTPSISLIFFVLEAQLLEFHRTRTLLPSYPILPLNIIPKHFLVVGEALSIPQSCPAFVSRKPPLCCGLLLERADSDCWKHRCDRGCCRDNYLSYRRRMGRGSESIQRAQRINSSCISS